MPRQISPFRRARRAFQARIAAVLLALTVFAGAAMAQDGDMLVPSRSSEGTLWFQSHTPRKSAGSAQLSALETPLGLQAVWLEWTEDHVYAALLGGGFTTTEILTPDTPPIPIDDLQGAATLNGGFIETIVDDEVTDVRPCVGSFLWTPQKLYLLAIGGGVDVEEVKTPGGASIPAVQGVAVIVSGIFDFDPAAETVEAHILGAALVYTPTAAYLVELNLSAGVTFATAEVIQPVLSGGGPITKTRGVAVVAGDFFPTAPPPVLRGAAFLWNHQRVFLLTLNPALTVTEVLKPGGGPMAQSWGIMPISGSIVGIPDAPVPRGAALIWLQGRAYLAAFLPALTVVEAQQPSGASIASGVRLPPGPPFFSPERQASFLYEIAARYFPPGSPTSIPGTVLGLNQRMP